jgi:hypothetical protein
LQAKCLEEFVDGLVQNPILRECDAEIPVVVGIHRVDTERLGFERLGRSPYYAMPMALVTPTAEELLKPEASGG